MTFLLIKFGNKNNGTVAKAFNINELVLYIAKNTTLKTDLSCGISHSADTGLASSIADAIYSFCDSVPFL